MIVLLHAYAIMPYAYAILYIHLLLCIHHLVICFDVNYDTQVHPAILLVAKHIINWCTGQFYNLLITRVVLSDMHI